MGLPIRPAGSSSTSLRAKPTLTTLPIDIKHEIFSYLLLGKNVKYFKAGTVPVYAYAFQMNIARTSKQLHKESDEYLRAHNNFALIHMKYPRLIHDFSPHIVVGQRAKSFKNPAIEATARAERILFLAQDLPHFCRHLQLEIHVWPSSQIYVHHDRPSTPIQYSPTIIKNKRKIVWKVNASHRSDLTPQERRTRQQSLISSISAVVGHDLDVRFLGVQQDIAAIAIASMTPRIVSVDAAGWNLLEHMQSQKRHLDESLVRAPQGSMELRRAYVMVAQLVDSSRSWLPTIVQYNTAFLFNTPYRRIPPRPVAMMGYQSEAEYHTMAGPWVGDVYITALGCLLNAMSLALDDGDFGFLSDVCGVAWLMAWNFQLHGALPRELTSLATHYWEWQDMFTKLFAKTLDRRQVCETMERFESVEPATATERSDYSYRKEDFDCLKSIHANGFPKDFRKCAPGLRRRKRTFIEPLVFERPSDMHGWTSDTVDNLSSQLKKSIIKYSEAAIQGKRIVLAEKTRAEGYEMLHVYDGTPP